MVFPFFIRNFAAVMSIKKIIIAVLAVFLPLGLQVDAAKPHKKSHKKSVSHKKSAKKGTKKKGTIKRTTTLAAAEAETQVAKTTNETLANSEDVSGETIVKTAMQFIGVPYKHGTSSPRSFDCSGFTSYVYKQYNISLSRCSRTQYTQGKVIKNKADLRAGDLVFFQGRSGRGGVGHVGIVTEVSPTDKSFKFVHASCSKGITTEKSTTAYYSSRYVGARRILQNVED